MARTERSTLLKQGGPHKNYETMMFGRRVEKPSQWLALVERKLLHELRNTMPREPVFRPLIVIVHDHTSGGYFYANNSRMPIPSQTPGPDDAEPQEITFDALSIALQDLWQVVNFIGKTIRLLAEQTRKYCFSRVCREYEIPDHLARGPLESLSTKLGPTLRGRATCYTLLLNDHLTALGDPHWKKAIMKTRDPAFVGLLATTDEEEEGESVAAMEEEEDATSEDRKVTTRPLNLYALGSSAADTIPTSSRSDPPDDS